MPTEPTRRRFGESYREPVFDGDVIGCQRCHGPVNWHVAQREQREPVLDKVDRSIVNPRHLERAVREAVCEAVPLQVARCGSVRRGRGL